MSIPGHDYTKRPESKGIDASKAKFTKYGKEQFIHDFVQDGKAGTEMTDIVKKAGGIKALSAAGKKLESDEVIDLNLNIYQANKIIKAGRVAEISLKKIQEAQKQTKTTEPKEEPKPSEGANE